MRVPTRPAAVFAAAFTLAALLAPTPARADRDSALAAVRAQSLVLDTRLDDRGTLWAMVKPERLAWDQFAVFLCKQVVPHQARIFTVKVVDVTSTGRGRKPEEWTVLAQARCG